MSSNKKEGITGYLDEDPDIKRQKWVCLSMLTPKDDKIRDKTYFEFREFLLDKYPDDFKDKEQVDVKFKIWAEPQQAALDELYREQKRGLEMPIVKIRGSYRTLEEAKERCKHLGKWDKTCNIYVAPVGRWVPADGKVRKTETEVFHAEQNMQNFMKSRKEVQAAAAKAFELRLEEAKRKKLDDELERKQKEENGAEKVDENGAEKVEENEAEKKIKI